MDYFDEELRRKKRGFVDYNSLGEQGDFGSQGFAATFLPFLREQADTRAYNLDTQKFFKNPIYQVQPFEVRLLDPNASGGRDLEIWRPSSRHVTGSEPGNRNPTFEVYDWDSARDRRWREADRPKRGGLSKSFSVGNNMYDPEMFAQDVPNDPNTTYEKFRSNPRIAEEVEKFRRSTR